MDCNERIVPFYPLSAYFSSLGDEGNEIDAEVRRERGPESAARRELGKDEAQYKGQYPLGDIAVVEREQKRSDAGDQPTALQKDREAALQNAAEQEFLGGRAAERIENQRGPLAVSAETSKRGLIVAVRSRIPAS